MTNEEDSNQQQQQPTKPVSPVVVRRGTIRPNSPPPIPTHHTNTPRKFVRRESIATQSLPQDRTPRRSVFSRTPSAPSLSFKETGTDTSTSGSTSIEQIVKQELIRKEILTTEQSYVAGLKIIRNRYMIPAKEQHIVSEPIHKKIFPTELGIITEVNDKFLTQLEKIIVLTDKTKSRRSMSLSFRRISVATSRESDMNIDVSSELANLILHYAQSFKLYTGYITQYPVVMQNLKEEMKNNKKFEQFIKSTDKHMKSERCNKLTDYLITPVQRIPRYVLLFEELLKSTDPDHEAYSKLQQSIELISTVAKYCNDKDAEFSNQFTMLKLQNTLKIDELTLPSRKLITKIKNELKWVHNGDYIDCDFFLFTDLFLVVERKKQEKKKKKKKGLSLALSLFGKKDKRKKNKDKDTSDRKYQLQYISNSISAKKVKDVELNKSSVDISRGCAVLEINTMYESGDTGTIQIYCTEELFSQLCKMINTCIQKQYVSTE